MKRLAKLLGTGSKEGQFRTIDGKVVFMGGPGSGGGSAGASAGVKPFKLNTRNLLGEDDPLEGIIRDEIQKDAQNRGKNVVQARLMSVSHPPRAIVGNASDAALRAFMGDRNFHARLTYDDGQTEEKWYFINTLEKQG